MSSPIYHLPRTAPHIALTFDDGPDIKTTPLLLNLLKKWNVKATFFLITKKLIKHPELGQSIVKEGHLVGNHSKTHSWFLPVCSKKFREELKESQKDFGHILGIEPRFFRPPRGLWTPKMKKWVEEGGMAMVLWSLMPGDYWFWHSTQRIEKKVLGKITDGDILVLHDGLKQATLSALENLLPVLTKQFSFVTLEQGLNINGYL